jgi:hypothetical protein
MNAIEFKENKEQILIPTHDRNYPFLVKINDNDYMVIDKNGSWSGDVFSKKCITKSGMFSVANNFPLAEV